MEEKKDIPEEKKEETKTGTKPMSARKKWENRYSRKDERTKVMQSLYQLFVMEENKEEAIDGSKIICSTYGVEKYEEVPAFSRVVYGLAIENLSPITDLLQAHLVNWMFDRLDNVAKAILVEAVSEANYGHLSPRNVIISEAVNLSKDYLKTNDYKFINAVLDHSLEHYDFPEKSGR